MHLFKEIRESVLHLLFPHLCSGCGTDLIPKNSSLCLRCLHRLPETHFEILPGNPVEKTFWGRLPLAAAAARYFFTKDSVIQHLLHQLKYKGDRELGLQLGRMMGEALSRSGRFETDLIIPLPLNPARERKRGYNQATLLCEGIQEQLRAPLLARVVSRPLATETQTNKSRVERWQNIAGRFRLEDPEALRGKRILLVDDVLTTGATLESCGLELLLAPGVQLSVATLCYTAR